MNFTKHKDNLMCEERALWIKMRHDTSFSCIYLHLIYASVNSQFKASIILVFPPCIDLHGKPKRKKRDISKQNFVSGIYLKV